MYLDRLSSRRGGGEEIMDSFVIDFKVGATQEVLSGRGATNKGEDVFHGAGNDTRFIFITTLEQLLTV